MAIVNLSDNKIRVTKDRGTDSTIGLMDPKVDMNVYCGEDAFWITGFVDTSGVLKLGLSSGASEVALQVYSHDCSLLYTTATGTWDFPAAGGSVAFGEVPPVASTGLNKFYMSQGGSPSGYTY